MNNQQQQQALSLVTKALPELFSGKRKSKVPSLYPLISQGIRSYLGSSSSTPVTRKVSVMPTSKRRGNSSIANSQPVVGRTYAPVGQATKTRKPAPNIVRSRNGKSIRIRHSEMISLVTSGSTAPPAFYLQQSLPINPGLAATFPWLAPQANQWEQYVFHSLSFEYVSRCPTSLAGSILMSPDYDSSDLPPSTEVQMSSYQSCVENNVWQDLCLRCNPQSLKGNGVRHYIRSSPLNTLGNFGSVDVKMYDAGVAYLALCGVNNAENFTYGKLWVTYDVELFIPQNQPTTANLNSRITSEYQNLAGTALAQGSFQYIAFGTPVSDPWSFGTQATVGGNASAWALPSGAFRATIELQLKVTGTASTAYTTAVQYGFLINGSTTTGSAGLYDAVNTTDGGGFIYLPLSLDFIISGVAAGTSVQPFVNITTSAGTSWFLSPSQQVLFTPS